jgi:hypothetical protein
MTQSGKERLFREAEEQRRACTEWLKTLMIPGVPKPATKDELYRWARDHLGASRSAFDKAWIWAIEDMGRQDWYEPSPRRKSPRQ